MLNRRELVSRRQAKRASRAAVEGVAGHQAAMAALGRASGWKGGKVNPATVGIIPEVLGGKRRVKSLDKPGSYLYTNENPMDSGNGKKRP